MDIYNGQPQLADISTQTANDLNQMAGIWSEQYHFWKAEDILRGFYEDRFKVIFVPAVASSPSPWVGALLYTVQDEVCEILFIYSDPSCRRRGLGRTLFAFLEDQLALLRCAYVDLEVRQTNETALFFYHSLGFFFVRQRQKYYRDGCDALVLRKRLGHA